MSYMGRGITRSAAVCLRHLAFEMATQLHSKVDMVFLCYTAFVYSSFYIITL